MRVRGTHAEREGLAEPRGGLWRRIGGMSRQRAAARLGLFAAVAIGAALVAWRLGVFDAQRLAELARLARTTRGVDALVTLMFAVLCVANVPTSAMTLVAGAIFGVVKGSLVSWVGSMGGAVGAYWLARTLGSTALHSLLPPTSRVTRLMGRRPTLWGQIRLRLIAILPFNALSLAAGLVRVPFRTFIIGAAIGSLPAIVLFAAVANSLLAGVRGARERAVLHLAVASALLLLLSYAPQLAKRLLRRRGVAR